MIDSVRLDCLRRRLDQLERLAVVSTISYGSIRKRIISLGYFPHQQQRRHDKHQSYHRQYSDDIDNDIFVLRWQRAILTVVQMARRDGRRRKLLMLLLLPINICLVCPRLIIYTSSVYCTTKLMFYEHIYYIMKYIYIL